MNVKRVKRGYYEITFKEICTEPDKTKPNEIAEKYMRSVEQLIYTQPEYWLWSHKRFKYKPEEYKLKTIN
jgi:KDO2-lipid IV(A) lauroyltransferase